ncbi:MAG: MBL fold metallo-hydrolase [Alicyclobacillus sp.]|nr:MBL fold metallo-hydrolase [Alicyclobacillus sp.]
MQIEFLGTAGPMSVPRPLCHCTVCEEAREKGVPYSRSCPGLFVHGPNILIDTSEDIQVQLNRSTIQEISGIFYSHWHPDHVMGRRVFELLNANYVNHPPKNTRSDVYLPEQVAMDFRRFLGTGEHLAFYQEKGWINVRVIKDGESVTIHGTEITPCRLAEEYAYGFLIKDVGKRVLIVPDETRGWEPARQLYGMDLLVLPIGVFEFHPLTGQRMVASGHPALQDECLFPETIDLIKKLNPKKTLLTHINGLSFDELKEVEKRLQADGLKVEIAYDTMLVDVS